jgi:DNA invertase Pin-like site-specific DNA recombinase
MAWSVDRLGRSLQDLIAFMQELRSLKIDLFLHQQGLDTTTPAGKMMFQVLGSFAEYERDMIRARVNAGIARAKAAGKHCGRPPLAPELAERIRQARYPGDCKQFFMVASKFPGLSWLRGSDARADSGSTP